LADIGVVYLYRFAEGERPVRAFLESYRAHPAGTDHDLHVVFKGFPDQLSIASARTLFTDLPINPIELDDTGFDIGSYFAAAKVVPNRRLIFFNTFTELLADDWLRKFDDALSLPGVGLAGATGSCQSRSCYYGVVVRLGWNRLKNLLLNSVPGPASGAPHIKEEQYSADREASQRHTNIDRLGNALNTLYVLFRVDRYVAALYQYGRFPNPHVRTSAFMIEKDRFLSLCGAPFNKKEDTYRFESGRRSMTKQILAQGLKPVVMDRNGKSYPMSEWKASSTFWATGQSNLIAADNQTRAYAQASQAYRIFLEDRAWVQPSRWVIEANDARLQGN
jgi:hypothetical protein